MGDAGGRQTALRSRSVKAPCAKTHEPGGSWVFESLIADRQSGTPVQSPEPRNASPRTATLRLRSGSPRASSRDDWQYHQEMQYRRFGRVGWSVSEIGYGMWGMAGWTGSEDRESFAVARPGHRARMQFLRYRVGLRRRPQRAAPRGDAASGIPGSGSTSRRRSRRRTASGRRGPSTRSKTSSLPTTSANTPRRAWRTSASTRWTSSSSTSGTMAGRQTSAGSGRCAR